MASALASHSGGFPVALLPMDSRHRVQLEIFEGPLDLLLHLIRQEEVDIYDIPLERITRQYLEALDTFRQLEIELAGEFVVMAAQLMYLKSRTLLPAQVQPPEDEADDDDPRWDLIRQLVEYKKFKDAALQLRRRAEDHGGVFPLHPDASETPPPPESALPPIGIFELIAAFQRVLARFEDAHSIGEIVGERFTVAEKMADLLESVPPGQTLPFPRLFAAAVSRGEVIVTFLALLELTRLHEFLLRQDQILGELTLTRRRDGRAAEFLDRSADLDFR